MCLSISDNEMTKSIFNLKEIKIMRSTRIIALILAMVMLAAALVGCGSAYDNPADYLELPADFSKLTVKYADLQKEIEDQIKTLRDSAAGQVFEPVTSADATVQMGDQVYISFKGTADKALPAGVKEKLSNEDYYLTIGDLKDTTLPLDYTTKNDNKTDNDKETEKVLKESIQDQLIGAKVGKVEGKLTGTFSNSYSTEELKNVTVSYEIEIKAIARVIVTKDHKVKVTYTVTDKAENVKVPEITTSAATATSTPVTTTTPATATATAPVTTTTAPTSSKAPTTTAKKATFAELFPGASTAKELDFSKTTTAFGTVFTLADLLPYFEGTNLYQEFFIKLTVPKDCGATNNAKYADYLGKDVYYSFKIESTTSTPEETDYFINKATLNQKHDHDHDDEAHDHEELYFKTTKDYRDYLEREFKKTLAYEAILEASKVTKMPRDEWEQSYENYLNQYACEYLATKDKNNTSNSSVTLEDYTPAEIEKLLPEKELEAIRIRASVSAQDSVKQRLTMEALFKLFKIKLSDKVYDSKMKEIKEEYNAYRDIYKQIYGISSFDQFLSSFYGGEEALELEWKYSELLDALTETQNKNLQVQFETRPSENAE